MEKVEQLTQQAAPRPEVAEVGWYTCMTGNGRCLNRDGDSGEVLERGQRVGVGNGEEEDENREEERKGRAEGGSQGQAVTHYPLPKNRMIQ